MAAPVRRQIAAARLIAPVVSVAVGRVARFVPVSAAFIARVVLAVLTVGQRAHRFEVGIEPEPHESLRDGAVRFPLARFAGIGELFQAAFLDLGFGWRARLARMGRFPRDGRLAGATRQPEEREQSQRRDGDQPAVWASLECRRLIGSARRHVHPKELVAGVECVSSVRSRRRPRGRRRRVRHRRNRARRE